MHRAFFRCNSGHYFACEGCPLDGWSSAESAELFWAVVKLQTMRQELTLSHLREAGLSESASRRTIVIEFGDEQSAVDAISPEGYFVNGRWIKQREFDARFT
jgi:hypothetical protein